MAAIAVVPIFMSAGAAVLPTILAGLAGALAIVFKPRELVRLSVQRPLATSLAAVGIALVLLIIGWWAMPGSTVRAASHGNAPARVDWAKVAENILAQERAGRTPTAIEQAVSTENLSAALIEDHDVSRCSYSGGPSPIKLQPLWNFAPEDTMFLAAPAVAGHRIYVAGCQAEPGGYTGILACLDSETGKPLWQVTEIKVGEREIVLRPFVSSPALTQDGKYLVIGQGLHEDHDCALLCFDAANGALRWQVPTPLHIESSPAIFGDLAVVGAGAIEGADGRAQGDPGYVFAVRISDGKELWRQAVNDPESSPAIDEDGMVYIGSGFNGCAVVAIRSGTDEQLRDKKLERVAWRAPLAYPVLNSISLSGDWVIAGAGNSDMVHSNQNARGLVVVLDRKTGQVRWQTPFNDAVLGGIAVRDDMLICPVRTGEVAALSIQDGHVLWHKGVSGRAPVLASCGFTGARVYAVSNDGYLAVMDAKDGTVSEKVYLNDEARAGSGLSMSPAQIAAGRVIVGSETGGIHCYTGISAEKGGK